MKKSLKKTKVFFDFDNTITTFDVLDGIIERFSEGEGWKKLESRWKRGLIGSKDCLKGQVEGLRLTKTSLGRYLDEVDIDPHFKRLLAFLRSREIGTVILSDSFDCIISYVLKRHGIRGMEVYSNSARLVNGGLVPRFPFSNASCGGCGHCKSMTMRRNASGLRTVYIGDGMSDRCASKRADKVFAKGSLVEYCIKESIAHTPYRGLHDVYDHLKGEFDGAKTKGAGAKGAGQT